MGTAVFDIVSPLPVAITRQALVEMLRDHETIIRLNPLIYEYKTIEPPRSATPEELEFQWYEIKDRIDYLPGGLWSGSIVYKACFHNHEDSLETHTYAPMGVKIVSKWTASETVGATLPGEIETENDTEGAVFLREDVELTCNMLLLPFVKRTMIDAHGNMAKLLGEKMVANLAKSSI